MKRKKGTRAVALAALLGVLTVAAGVAALLNSGIKPASSWPDVPGIDARAQDVTLRGTGFSRPNADDELSYRIGRSLTLRAWDRAGKLELENPPENRQLMAMELVLDATGEVLLRTGYLKPGQKIASAALDMPLPAGVYPVTAHIWAVSFDNRDLLGVLEQPVTLTIET